MKQHVSKDALKVHEKLDQNRFHIIQWSDEQGQVDVLFIHCPSAGRTDILLDGDVCHQVPGLVLFIGDAEDESASDNHK